MVLFTFDVTRKWKPPAEDGCDDGKNRDESSSTEGRDQNLTCVEVIWAHPSTVRLLESEKIRVRLS